MAIPAFTHLIAINAPSGTERASAGSKTAGPNGLPSATKTADASRRTDASGHRGELQVR